MWSWTIKCWATLLQMWYSYSENEREMFWVFFSTIFGIVESNILHFSLSCIGEGNGNPLQCSCLENPRDGEAWWAADYGVAQSQTRLKRLSSSSSSRVKYILKGLSCLKVLCWCVFFQSLYFFCLIDLKYTKCQHAVMINTMYGAVIMCQTQPVTFHALPLKFTVQ